MAIQTLADLRERVKAWANRTDISDDLYTDFINIALARALRSVNIPPMERLQTVIVNSDGNVSIPHDYKEAISLFYQYAGKNRRVMRKADHYVLEKQGVLTTAYPQYYATVGANIYTSPALAQGETLTLQYYRILSPLVTDTDTNWFVTDAPEVLVYGALVEVFGYVRETEEMVKWEAKFVSHLTEIQNMSDKEMWSGSTLTINSSGSN